MNVMKSYADAQRHEAEFETQTMQDVDGTTIEGAKAILVSTGGRKAARRALQTLWEASKKHRAGWLPTAKVNAPLRVLQALAMTGLIEKAEDGGQLAPTAEDYLSGEGGRGKALRYRLTNMGVAYAQKAEASARRK